MIRETEEFMEEARTRFPVRTPKYQMSDFIPTVGWMMRDWRRFKMNQLDSDRVADYVMSHYSPRRELDLCKASGAAVIYDFWKRESISRFEPLMLAWPIGLPAVCLAGNYLMGAMK